jgi:hypothetical protein
MFSVRSLWLTHEALRHKGVWWSGLVDPRYLDLSTNCKRSPLVGEVIAKF